MRVPRRRASCERTRRRAQTHRVGHAAEASTGNQRILITGATGMVGGAALRMALERDDVGAVLTVGRRRTGVEPPKLTEVVHEDFTPWPDDVARHLEGVDAALFCMGVYTGSAPDDVFRRLTVDYPVELGRALHARSPQAVFCLLSGQGADPSGQSRMAFARYKGEAEAGLSAQGLARVNFFRPGFIYPVEAREEPNFSYRAMRAVYPLLKGLSANLSITPDQLAAGMLKAALDGTGAHAGPVLENRDIRQLVG